MESGKSLVKLGGVCKLTGMIWLRGRNGRSREKGKGGAELWRTERRTPRAQGEELTLDRRTRRSVTWGLSLLVFLGAWGGRD